MNSALVTGINGQDGYYLSEFLLLKGYGVYGMSRGGIKAPQLNASVVCVAGDLVNKDSLYRCIEESNPDEVYNLGGISSVKESWRIPELAKDINGVAVVRLLEVIKDYNK